MFMRTRGGDTGPAFVVADVFHTPKTGGANFELPGLDVRFIELLVAYLYQKRQRVDAIVSVESGNATEPTPCDFRLMRSMH